MKHRMLGGITGIALSVTTLISMSACFPQDSSDRLTPITLNEVAHSIFYAPQYVAIENGYFEEEGISLTLVTGFGADKVMTSLVSGDADIGFMGSESSVYVYNEGSADYAVNFAQLTQRAGNFLVSRTPQPDFNWDSLRGSTVLGGRAGGMPEMILEYILKNKGIDYKMILQSYRILTLAPLPVLSKAALMIMTIQLSLSRMRHFWKTKVPVTL